ncbi:MAG: hypothetical protein HS109_05630 [Burkholderiales bacterium]|nr:hypothetical protein [Burkholderiales bacterium]
MTRAPLSSDTVRELRAALSRFGPPHDAARRSAWARGARAPFADAHALVAWHDLMLFVLAHPANLAEHARAQRELERVARAARTIGRSGSRADRRALRESGIAWTRVEARFGLAFARWLVARHPGRAVLDAVDDEPMALGEAIAAALPPAQADIASGGHLDGNEIATAFAPGGDRLAWLVRVFDALDAPAAHRDQLFEAIGASTRLDLADSPLSRTFLRGPSRRPFCVTRLVRDPDVAATLETPLATPRGASLREREAALDASRGAIAVLGRETDAMATTSARDSELHALGRGLVIALHAPSPDRAGAYDAHVGFGLYRNGVPVAYGGGWPFAGGCRIGVNVFPAFRGGESAWLFAQVLRAYRQRFHVVRFVVEPYQYGAGNREGLESGAFWFYWRLGFRPVVPRVRALAEAEAAKLAADRDYRAPIAMLRRFTTSDIALDLAPGAAPPDAAELAEAASDWLARRGRGDFAHAERFALAAAERLLGRRAPASGPERDAWRAFAPLLAQLPSLARWSARERAHLAALLDLKARDTFAFQRNLAASPRLCQALSTLATRRRAELC